MPAGRRVVRRSVRKASHRRIRRAGSSRTRSRSSPGKRRWGSVREIKHITRIFYLDKKGRLRYTAAYKRLPTRLKHLVAWRRMHMGKGHVSVRSYARAHGYKHSADLPLTGRRGGKGVSKPSKIHYIQTFLEL